MSKWFILLVYSIMAFQVLPSPPTTLPVAEVMYIVDGDTVGLRFDGEETATVCRFAGVNTPEINKADKPDEPYGREADTFARNLLKGERVWVEKHGRGRRARLLVSLFRVPDGLFVNLEIIRQGYGKVYLQGNFEKKQLFLDYQEFAKQAKKGIWAERDDTKGNGHVYIASSGHGTRYHRTADCYHVRDKSLRIPLAEALRKKLLPCLRCKPSK